MRKILHLALIVLMMVGVRSTINARVVDYAEALQEAIDFFRSNSMSAAASDVKEVWNSNDLVENGVATIATTATPTFYVFAPEEGKGFVIVSADDATMSILGYSLDKEIIVGDDMPTNFRWWCEMMDKLITQLRATGAESAKKNAASQAVSTLAASDMLFETAEWNQYEPYNLQCPMDGSSRSVTGCVPVAFAIAMRYHEYPTQGIGQSDAYYTDTKGIYVESRDLSSHVYDWDNMLLQYGNTWTDAQGSAVATLIADIGCVLHADFTSAETGTAVGYSTPTYFYEHFNYSSSSIMLVSPAYSDAEWTEIMKNEIATNGPVPYTSVNLVHQVVLDGYNSNNYFHINWGWGGYNNGYFLLPDIADGVDQQWAFLDFIPDDGKKATALALSNYSGVGLEADTDIFTQNVPFTMSQIYFVNAGSVDFNGVVAFGLTDSDGNVKEIISNQVSVGDFGSMYISWLNATTCTITASMVPGDCIRLCYKNNGDSDWRSMLAYDSGLTYRIVLNENMIDNKPYDSASGLYFNILNEKEVEVTWGGNNDNVFFYSGDVTIPESVTIDGTTYSVVGIGYLAFGNCTDLTSVTFPSSLTYIGEQAFSNCTKLSGLSLPGSLTDIKDYAFSACSALTGELTIPNSVVTIGTNAFVDCTGLTSIVLGSGVTTVGNSAFQGCAGVTKLTLGENVETIGATAFSGTILEGELIIPDKVKTIGEWAFSGCNKLTSLTIGSGVTTIEGSAFNSCDGLAYVVSLNTTPPTCGEGVFADVNIGEMILHVQKGYASVYSSAGTWSEFGNIYELADENGKFYGGLYYNILNENEVEVTWGSTNNETSTPEYTGDIAIPWTVTYLGTTYNVTAIGDYAFYRCPITSLSMTANVKTIGTDVSYYCSSLTSLSLSDNIETIGDRAFYGCYNLPMELIIPAKVTSIGEDAFYDCEKLTSVTFNADLETIGRGAFHRCAGLTCDLVIPDKVTSVGINAFYGCPVTSITVGKSVKTIGNSAFFACSSATFVALGTSVETIGENAFSNCSALTSVTTLNPTPPSLGISAFNSVTATIYVPAGTTAEYKRVWGDNQGDVAGYEDLSYAVLILSLTDENGTAYTTYYNEDYDIDIADTGITAYWAESVEDDAVTLAELSTSVIPAKTAVLLIGDPINYMPAGADSPSASASAYAGNLFYGQSTTKTIDDLGSGYQYYTLSADTNGENIGFYYGVEGGGVFESQANKAWLATPAGLPSVLSIKFKGDTTGISSLSPDYGENDAIYTIQGVRVSSMNKPGIYIVGGKKVLVK